ncbi:glutathione S-transferase family protein [Asaia platycodi]
MVDVYRIRAWAFFRSGRAFSACSARRAGLRVNRYRREVERHYTVLDQHLTDRRYIVGDTFTIADMSAWGWLERAPRVLKEDYPLERWPALDRFMHDINARSAVSRVQALMKRHAFKTDMDDQAQRALFPSNFPIHNREQRS